MDREKVIGHLNDCMEASRRDNTWVFVRKDIVEDALALLKEQEDIETLAIRNIVPNYLVHKIEFVKTDMANRMARKLVAEGFMEFFINEKYEPMDVTTEIEARIRVEKPIQESR